jgi:PadR family transcriptional regulator AphA
MSTRKTATRRGGPVSRTRYALLGILTNGPMSGYDMKQFIDESISHFWSESYGNLYPRLRELHEEGLIDRRQEPRDAAPDAYVYTLTEAGKKAFVEWIEQPSLAERVRDELLLRVFFGCKVPLTATIRQIEDFARRQEATLSTFRGIAATLDREHADNPCKPYWLMTLRRGELVAEARLAWAKESLDTLGSMAKS